MQAVILAGGMGTRLQPYTTVLPKPLMPIGDYPILEVVLRQLKRFGFNRVTLAVGYHFELFQAFFQDGRKWGIHIEYSLEERPLGTVAPLKLAKGLDEHFLVMNGDILSDLNYGEFLTQHIRENRTITLSTKRRSVKIDYGVLETGPGGQLTAYREKPQLDYVVGMGVAAFSRKVVDFIPEERHYDMPDLAQDLMQRGMPIICRPFDGYWLDIGRPEDYRVAVDEFQQMRAHFLGETGPGGEVVEAPRGIS